MAEPGNPEPSFAGIDGCRAGWIMVLAHPLARDALVHQVTICPRFDDVLALLPASAVSAVDIPIGLLAAQQPGGRDCDRCARRLLGRRASSVFTPPIRPLLDATHYAQVRGHGLSIQAFNILPKIRDVDRVMTPALQQRVYEAHPELAFQALAGQPLQHSKKTVAGREERLRVLDTLPSLLFHRIRAAFEQSRRGYKRTDVAPDDILDAYVLVWTALRIWRAQAYRVPRNPPYDARGLRMEIWY
jgi:predicted RNase H-like nuclease